VRPFLYLRDPLFIAASTAYLANRGLGKRWTDGGFLHDHCNDLLLVAVCVPPLLWVLHRLGLRSGSAFPQGHEIAIPIAVIAVVFEVLLPGLPGVPCTADPWDVLAYAAGGIGAALFWEWHSRSSAAGGRESDCGRGARRTEPVGARDSHGPRTDGGRGCETEPAP